MLRTRFKLIWLAMLTLLVLGACGGSGDTPAVSDSDLVLTQAAEIANQGLTQTAAAQPPAATNTSAPTATATVTVTSQIVPTNAGGTQSAGATFTPLPTQLFTQTPFFTPTQQASGGTGCYRANLETENIPDGTKFLRGKTFTKVWRLKNIGTCTWTPAFSLRWMAGDLIGAPSVVPLTTEDVPTNGYVNAQVTFTTGMELGVFTSYWMIISDDGVIFGLGPDGTGWFWVKIEVYNPDA